MLSSSTIEPVVSFPSEPPPTNSATRMIDRIVIKAHVTYNTYRNLVPGDKGSLEQSVGLADNRR